LLVFGFYLCYNVFMKKLCYTAECADGGIKISEYLRSRCGFSRALVTCVKYGGVSVNGNVVHMRHIVFTGDLIEVTFPREENEWITPIDIPLDIVYEDDYILAVCKPQNMPTHPSKGNSLPTLANAVAYYLGGGMLFRAVNRLDRDTSGIVIIAKDKLTSGILSDAMKRGEFEKIYIAMLSGTPKKESGLIDAPIERECEGSIKRVVTPSGKRALTEYRVTKILPSGDSLCEIRLHTGRTHQIRVHMAYIGHPLRYDFLYGERVPGESYRLHCKSISFPHPKTHARITLTRNAEFEDPLY